ncbi:MAG: hypothetical protein V8S32_01890 [Lachnospiraceae bacterium]
MKLPGGKKTKTGYSTAAEIVSGKAGAGIPHRIGNTGIPGLAKLKSTYADGLAGVSGKMAGSIPA